MGHYISIQCGRTMKYIGLDIHKKETRACVLDEKGKIVHVKRIRTDVEDIGHWFKDIETETNDELKVVMEATGFYFWIHVPSNKIRELRDLTRHRESLVRKKGDLKREIIGALDQYGIKVPAEFKTNFSNKYIEYVRGLDVFIINKKLDLLGITVEKLKNVENMIEERYGKDEEVELMMTMPGVGIVTASVFKGEIGDIARFQSFGNLATYAGLTPSRSQSGEKEWFGPTGHGNDRIKHVLIGATLSHVHHKNDTKIRDFYEQKKGALGVNKVIVATARKMLETLYFMLLRKETYHAH